MARFALLIVLIVSAIALSSAGVIDITSPQNQDGSLPITNAHREKRASFSACYSFVGGRFQRVTCKTQGNWGSTGSTGSTGSQGNMGYQGKGSGYGVHGRQD